MSLQLIDQNARAADRRGVPDDVIGISSDERDSDANDEDLSSEQSDDGSSSSDSEERKEGTNPE